MMEVRLTRVIVLAWLMQLLGATAAAAVPRTVLYVPLDERFATRGLFLNLARLLPASEYKVVTPDADLLPSRKRFADPDKILDWLEAQQDGASNAAAVVSAEMVLYGGLIASRSSNDTAAVVSARLERLSEMGRRGLEIHLSTVVMRIPSYNGDFEEPWYWENFGRALYEYSFHKGRYDVLHEQEDARAFKNISQHIPPNVLRQFLWRRQRNLGITERLFHSMAPSASHGSGPFRPPYVSVYCTLDDSGVYGLNVEEATTLRKLSVSLDLPPASVKIYPGADEVGLSLLAKLIVTDLAVPRPTAKILWRMANATSLIPNYESQPIEDTVKDQLHAAGLEWCQGGDTRSPPTFSSSSIILQPPAIGVVSAASLIPCE